MPSIVIDRKESRQSHLLPFTVKNVLENSVLNKFVYIALSFQNADTLTLAQYLECE